MATNTQLLLIKCDNCQLPLPIRLAKPGEVGSSWQCAGCGARYFGVLDVEGSQDAINNVSVPSAPNPRIMVGRKLVAELHRRAPFNKAVIDSRKHLRTVSDDAMVLIVDDSEIPSKTIDVSAGGVGCFIPIAIRPGREILMRFTELPNTPTCAGVVRSCDTWEDGYRLGIAFTH